MTLSLFLISDAQEVPGDSAKKPDFAELTMKDGRVLRNGFVSRVEADETERQKAALEKAQTERETLELAKTEWVPVEATVLRVTEAGALIDAKRISMVPTKVRSTLGFLNEGPPERILERFSAGAVLLKGPARALTRSNHWKGYLNPVPDGFVIDPESGLATIPAHSGVTFSP